MKTEKGRFSISGPATGSGEPVTDKRQLVDYLAAGCKPPGDWRIGCEQERFAFMIEDHCPLPHSGVRSVQSLLEGLQRFGWQPIREGMALVALVSADGSVISLEPGGQIELSGTPLHTVHEIHRAVTEHHHQVCTVAKPLGIGLLALGFQPLWRREDIPWMPKERYSIMRAHMPRVGRLGLDMMLRTCTIQINLDYESEADMVRKYRAALALQPVATALFANSPFVDGRPSGFLSYRSHVWTDTDPSRCGMLPFVFASGMGFERYVDYVLDVPLYHIYRNGRYINAGGQSFRHFMAGRLPALWGEGATLADWETHLTTVFPEVRLKRFLEMRGVDAGPLAHVCALSALWSGLLYSSSALEAALALIRNWTADDREKLRQDVPRFGMKTSFQGRTVRDVALEMLEIAQGGLRSRQRRNENGQDESVYLEPLFTIAKSGRTPAECLLDRYFGHWAQSVDPLFDAVAE
ncbi:Glutamate--cysteine ligase [invertebrate metagenome]|uniref:glutamate--cysteine ligase n=1 Tax=invertebrate metagenome TaxID=1711999 RepID=A0A484H6D0_9ZZZZ